MHDHRREPRVSDPGVSVTIPSLGVTAPVRDISAGGFAMSIEKDVQADAEHVVEFRPTGALRVVLRASLAHCHGIRTRGGRQRYVAGFSFVQTDYAHEAAILLMACLPKLAASQRSGRA